MIGKAVMVPIVGLTWGLMNMVDFDRLEDQRETFHLMGKCKVSFGGWPDTEGVSRALREYAKHNHPDLLRANGDVTSRGACSAEETNQIRDRVKESGADFGGWLLWKLRVPKDHAHIVCFLTCVLMLGTAASVFAPQAGTKDHVPHQTGAIYHEQHVEAQKRRPAIMESRMLNRQGAPGQIATDAQYPLVLGGQRPDQAATELPSQTALGGRLQTPRATGGVSQTLAQSNGHHGLSPLSTASVLAGRGIFLRVMIFLGLISDVRSAVLDERQLIPQFEYAEFAYGFPPCATHCGLVPSKCIDKGWLENDVYMYWYDEVEKRCKLIKSPVPTSTVSGLSKNAMGMGLLGLLNALQDGAIDPTDLLSLYGGYAYAKDAKLKEDEGKKVQKLINHER